MAQKEITLFRTPSTELGLSNGTVYSFYQDETGFLWLGTANGLNKYDGYSFEQPEQLASLLHGMQIRVIRGDGAGGMWLGTDQGLIRLDAQRKIAAHYRADGGPSSIIHEFVTDVRLDERNEPLVATIGGVCRLNPETGVFQVLPQIKALLGERLHCLWLDRDGTIWVGSGQGLGRFDPERGDMKIFRGDPTKPGGLGNKEVRAIYRDRLQTLWIGTHDGLFRFEPDGDAFLRHPLLKVDSGEKGGRWINVLREDDAGRLWIGTRTSGITVLNKDRQVSRFFKADPYFGDLPSNNVIDLFFDRTNMAWAGTFKSGPAALDLKPKKFQRFLVDNIANGSDFGVTSLFEDSRGQLWLGNQDGLFRHDPETGQTRHFGEDPGDGRGLSTRQVLCLNEDRRGRIWAGTFLGGINIYDPQNDRFSQYRFGRRETDSLPSDTVNVLVRSEHGGLWIGTSLGLARFDEDSELLSRIPLVSIRGRASVYAIVEKNDSVWVGTDNGLYQLREGQPTRRFDPSPNGLISIVVTSLLVDSDGIVWVGSYEGLCRFDPDLDDFTPLKNPALTGKTIRGMVEGLPGEIWIGTNAGLARLRANDDLRWFDRIDGLQSKEFSRGACFKNDEGRIFFGGPKGYNVFSPEKMVDNPYIPRVAITDFHIFEQKTPIEEKINREGVLVLSEDENYFSLEFAALDFTAPEANQYAYRLDGFDEDWVYPGTRRWVAYTNLDQRDYRFRVKASNNDGVWNEKGLVLGIRVKGPFWKQPLFSAVLGLLLAASILLLHKFLLEGSAKKKRRLSAMADKRSEALTELHHQLLEEARKAGSAEVTTGMLHNIGNILNSMGVSVELILQSLDRFPIEKLRRVNRLLKEHDGRLATFIGGNAKGRLLSPFYQNIQDSLIRENELFDQETRLIRDNIGLMSRAVSLEQSFGTQSRHNLEVHLNLLLEDALKLQGLSLKKRNIRVDKYFSPTPACRIDRFKLIHVVVNLIRNASDAILARDLKDERGVLEIHLAPLEDGWAEIQIKDNGCGVSSENLPRIFDYGFTTKSTGNGFGLHTCKLAMEEIGGKITAGSKGPGKGAAFILKIPPMGREAS